MSGPLSNILSTATAKTSVPLIADGQYCGFRLTELTLVDGEKGKTAKFKYELTSPTITTDNTPLLPGEFGSIQFVNVPCYAKPDAKDPGWFVKRISSYVDALLGTGDAHNPKGKPARPEFFDMAAAQQNVLQLDQSTVSALLGKELIAKMKVRTGEYEGNEFAAVFHPADVAKK